MGKVRIVTDSTADIPHGVAQELEIEVVPLQVKIGEHSYRDGVDLDAPSFYTKILASEELPTTSQPSPQDFTQAYQKCIAEGAEAILSIHLSSALSGTYQSSTLAKGLLADEKVEIVTMDSRNATFCTGQMVIQAARAAKAGQSLEACQQVALDTRKGQAIYAYLDTLEYLQKGGRIGKASSLVGSLLSIKPIISLDEEGTVIPIDRVRGRKKAAQRLFQLLQEHYPRGSKVDVALLHGHQKDEVEKWLQTLQEMYDIHEHRFIYFGPTIAAHLGPSAFGILLTPVIEV
jgi:DegV family protein with EDD domain